MARITITIDTDGAAFGRYTEGEIVRLLNMVSANVRDYGLSEIDAMTLRDYNGDTCGHVTVSEEPTEDEGRVYVPSAAQRMYGGCWI